MRPTYLSHLSSRVERVLDGLDTTARGMSIMNSLTNFLIRTMFPQEEAVHDTHKVQHGQLSVGQQHRQYSMYRLRRSRGDSTTTCNALCMHSLARVAAAEDGEEDTEYQLVENFFALPGCWKSMWTQELMQRSADELAQMVKATAERLKRECRIGIPTIVVQQA